jgi:RNA polymerase sigma factor (sigma-70 family)
MGSATGKDFVLTAYARDLIRIKSKKLRRRGDFRSVAPEDIRQDLWTAVFRAVETYDPTKASIDTFVDRVVAAAVASLVRSQGRDKRRIGRLTQSLDDVFPSASETPEPLLAQTSAADLARRTGNVQPDERMRSERAEAFACALSQMPAAVHDVCRRVMGGTVTSAARDLGVSRRQVRKVLAEAKPYFEWAGFEMD